MEPYIVLTSKGTSVREGGGGNVIIHAFAVPEPTPSEPSQFIAEMGLAETRR